MSPALLKAGRVPCLAPSEHQRGTGEVRCRLATGWKDLASDHQKRARGVLIFLLNFSPRTGNLLQIISIGKFSRYGAGLPPARSTSHWLRNSRGVGTSYRKPGPPADREVCPTPRPDYRHPGHPG